MMLELAESYGGTEMVAAIKDRGLSARNGPDTTGHIEDLDDFSACKIETGEDIKALFVDRFYFGCEADDSTNAWAFNRKNNPYGARLNTLFGSDIGHFDVQDMAGVLPEAYELVEDEKITGEDFRAFVFDNPVRFWGETNPEFFAGTAVAEAAKTLLSG